MKNGTFIAHVTVAQILRTTKRGRIVSRVYSVPNPNLCHLFYHHYLKKKICNGSANFVKQNLRTSKQNRSLVFAKSNGHKKFQLGKQLLVFTTRNYRVFHHQLQCWQLGNTELTCDTSIFLIQQVFFLSNEVETESLTDMYRNHSLETKMCMK